MVPPPQSNVDIDQATLSAAGRVLDEMGYDGMMRQMLDKMADQFGPQMARVIEGKTGKPANPEMIRRLAAAQNAFLRKFASGPQLRRAIELLYTKHFSADELNRMADLMRDPIMQKWNSRMPSLMADMMPLITAQIEANGGELKAEISAIIDEYLDAPAPGSTIN